MAYEIGGRFGNSCHEEIGAQAFIEIIELLAANEDVIELPTDKVTRKLTDRIHERFTSLTGMKLTEKQAFMLMSMMVGVRAPDTDGHASANLAHTRAEHSNPEDDAQYVHFCRGKDDNYQAGNIRAAEQSAALFKEHVKKARHYQSIDSITYNFTQELYIDYYGMVDLNVNAVAFYAGVAAHTIADSFSHTIRSQADGFKKVIMVMNYIEAIYPNYDEERDGVRHSNGTDECDEKENLPIVEAAKRATQEYADAFIEYYKSGDESYLDQFCEQWFSLRNDCYNNYALCDSESWYQNAKHDATHAYLECSTSTRSPATPFSLPTIILLISGVLYLRKRQSKKV